MTCGIVRIGKRETRGSLVGRKMTLTTRTTLTALGPDGFAVGKNATVTLERGVSFFNNYASRGKKTFKNNNY